MAASIFFVAAICAGERFFFTDPCFFFREAIGYNIRQYMSCKAEQRACYRIKVLE
jgi:hypothetical protein